ncbi:MAG: hypothetical protein NE327_21335 [Lentisphaeraceae bacterium]|nr:hypothetical protein [Lentisphaeraceae bacterium]
MVYQIIKTLVYLPALLIGLFLIVDGIFPLHSIDANTRMIEVILGVFVFFLGLLLRKLTVKEKTYKEARKAFMGEDKE